MSVRDYVVTLTPRNYSRWASEFLDYASSFGDIAFLLEDSVKTSAYDAFEPVFENDSKHGKRPKEMCS